MKSERKETLGIPILLTNNYFPLFIYISKKERLPIGYVYNFFFIFSEITVSVKIPFEEESSVLEEMALGSGSNWKACLNQPLTNLFYIRDN